MKLRNKKTGEIVDFLTIDLIDSDEMEFTYLQASGHENSWSYNSLEKFNAEWEDYKPAKPLIKDEKIRKAVRAWAEACGSKTVEITHSRPHMLRIMDATGDDEICFNREIGQVFDEIIYNTIAELCGEEEE